MPDANPEVIVILYSDGTTETYSNCTGFTHSNGVISFTGQLSGQSTTKVWTINFSTVKKYSREPQA